MLSIDFLLVPWCRLKPQENLTLPEGCSVVLETFQLNTARLSWSHIEPWESKGAARGVRGVRGRRCEVLLLKIVGVVELHEKGSLQWHGQDIT
jgi:hypothetical protein